jgi:uncharacterized protein (DUF433 family)
VSWFLLVDHEVIVWRDCDVVERHPEKLGGAWVFRGTRVPLAALFENLRDGASIDQFLEWFPGVQRARVEAVLEHEAMVAAHPEAS